MISKTKYPAWGNWQIKTSWYAIGHRSKDHLFISERKYGKGEPWRKTSCGRWINPDFGCRVILLSHGQAKNKCKLCLRRSDND